MVETVNTWKVIFLIAESFCLGASTFSKNGTTKTILRVLTIIFAIITLSI